jgi:hypothetical protein
MRGFKVGSPADAEQFVAHKGGHIDKVLRIAFGKAGIDHTLGNSPAAADLKGSGMDLAHLRKRDTPIPHLNEPDGNVAAAQLDG